MSPLILSALRLPVGIAGYIQTMSSLSISYSLVQKRQKSLMSTHTYQNQKTDQRKKQAQVLILTNEIPLFHCSHNHNFTTLYWSQLRTKVTTFTQSISYYSTIITYLLTVQISSTTTAYYYLLLYFTTLLLSLFYF